MTGDPRFANNTSFLRSMRPEKRSLTDEEKEIYYDENGRFKKGHPGMPNAGRKTKVEELAYLEAMREGMPPDEMSGIWRAAIRAAIEHAEKYQSPKYLFKAVELMMLYGYGKPVQAITLEGDSLLESLKALIQDDDPAASAVYIEGHFTEEVKPKEQMTTLDTWEKHVSDNLQQRMGDSDNEEREGRDRDGEPEIED